MCVTHSLYQHAQSPIKNHRFSPENRLKTAPQFKKILDHGDKIHGRFWIMFYAENDLPYCRLGVIVSKKTSRLSVRRNRLKRVVREFFRLHNTDMIRADKRAYDVVVIAKKSSVLQDDKKTTVFVNDLFHLKKQLLAFTTNKHLKQSE